MAHKDIGNFQGRLGSYQVIKTEDGSHTLKSPLFDEACHSLNGAYAETLHNYIGPNRIEDFYENEDRDVLNILEVGFGLGVGAQATAETIDQKINPSHRLNYFALELDEGLIEYARDHTQIKSHNLPVFRELKRYEQDSLVYYRAQKKHSCLTILIGDARESLPLAIKIGLCPKFHVIYQDPFSPRKNPGLWTQEWFELLASTSQEMASLSTYCASVSPRKAMLEAGFRPRRLKGMGFKREITHAILNAVEAQDEQLEVELRRSKAITLRDKNVQEYRN